jgi:hypothetical protein
LTSSAEAVPSETASPLRSAGNFTLSYTRMAGFPMRGLARSGHNRFAGGVAPSATSRYRRKRKCRQKNTPVATSRSPSTSTC